MEATEWAGVVHDTLYILRQIDTTPPTSPAPISFRSVPISASAQPLRRYLRADDDSRQQFADCVKSDAAFRRAYSLFGGARLLRVPVVECLFSFICSSNNNVSRISDMTQYLARAHGKEVAEHDGVMHYTFPSAESLAKKATEEELRNAGFGYRAPYVVKTAIQLTEMAKREGMTGEELLSSWKLLSRTETAEKLMMFDGVGRKVAGCVALMGLEKTGEVPVDTHVWKMAKRYMPELGGKTLTKRVYEKIGTFFRRKFGEEFGGVAHNVLFVAELPRFKKIAKGAGLTDMCWNEDEDDTTLRDVYKIRKPRPQLTKVEPSSLPKQEPIVDADC